MKAAMELVMHLETKYKNDYFEMLSILSVTFTSMGLTLLGPMQFWLVLQKMQQRLAEVDSDTKMTQPDSDTKMSQKHGSQSLRDHINRKKKASKK